MSHIATHTFAASLILLLSSCASLPSPSPVELQTGEVVRHTTVRSLIAQIGFGPDATFVVCRTTECPAVTPKTIASYPAARASVAFDEPLRVDLTAPPRSPTTPLPPSPVSNASPDDGRLMINFPYASAELLPAAKDAIRRSLPLAHRSKRIVISGRTDSVGVAALNQSLAMRRALAVRNYYRDIDPSFSSNISFNARGSCCFVAGNSDEIGRARNRRVEIVFIKAGS